MKCTIFNNLFKMINIKGINILIFCFLFTSNSYAGGSSSSGEYCNADNVNHRKQCTPYDVPLPSWDEIRSKAFSNVDLNINIKVPMVKDSTEYFLLDKDQGDAFLKNYASCSTNDGAERYTISDKYVGDNIKAHIEYCTSFRVGIKEDYLKYIHDTDNIDISKIKIFCENSRRVTDQSPAISSFDDAIGIGNKVSISQHIVCRDGTIKTYRSLPSLPDQCKCAERIERQVKDLGWMVEKYYGLNFNKGLLRCVYNVYCPTLASGCYWMISDYDFYNLKDCVQYYHCIVAKTYSVNYYSYEDCNDDGSNCKTRHGYEDISTYDTSFIRAKKYNIDICQKPVIKKSRDGIKIEKLYDPNLLYE